MSGFPWRTALFISVALNLAIVSAAIGAYGAGARIERPGPVSAAGAAPNLGPPRRFLASLPPEARASVGQSLARTWANSAPLRAAARAARIEVANAAREDAYDPARVKAALARMREADSRVLSTFHDAAADAFAQLTPAQRRAALTALANRQAERRAAWNTGAADPAPSPALEGAAPGAYPLAERLAERRAERRARRRERMQADGAPAPEAQPQTP